MSDSLSRGNPPKMARRKLWPIAAVLGLSLFTAGAHAQDSVPAKKAQPVSAPHNQVLYIEPVTMWIIYNDDDINVFSLGYERLLGRGWSLLLNFHGNYYSDKGSDNDYYTEEHAEGIGLGLRRYIAGGFSGSYLTLQSDYINSERSGKVYNYSGGYYDQFGNWVYAPSGGATFHEYPHLWLTQFSCGYKWQMKYLVIDMSVGGAAYVGAEIYTGLTTSGSIGLPFNSSTFAF